ncbi:hypothetical protein ACH9D2_18185 [Kocuria sp. M4R2S49]|uniref:hypothetical protein n=1 Tax=Kocuria rhizosphaericola TaxID=3376284 RepID=UPI0037A202D3
MQSGKKLNFSIRVFCEADRTMELRQSFWEQDNDPGDSDLRGQHIHRRTSSGTDSVVLDRVVDAFNTESGAEKVFHSVQFRTSRGHAGNWNGGSASEDRPGVLLSLA